MSSIRCTMLAGLLLAVFTGMPTHAADKPGSDHLYGPPPTWDAYRAIAEAGLQARLIDPESARITWTTGFFKGDFKPFLSARVWGYIACGSVNAKNRLGGYTGATTFITVIDYDRVLYAEIDEKGNVMTDAACALMAREGKFPPLPATTLASAPSSLATTAQPTPSGSPIRTQVGLSLQPMPDGAYVGAVAPASPAAAAGVKPGMVIASVNAIPLAGMGDAMVKVVDAAGPTASLGIIGGKTIRLGGQP